MASTVFSETLQSITTTKLTELSKKRTLFEEQKASVLVAAQKEVDQRQRLHNLINGVNKIFFGYSFAAGKRKRGNNLIMANENNDEDLGVLLKNLTRFQSQAMYDPSISPKLLGGWESSLINRLTVQSLKYQYATLYGELVTEWLNAEKATKEQKIPENLEGFEKINRAEKDAARQEWEKLVFEPFETDPMAISEYLRNLFGEDGGNKQASKALTELRKSVANFERLLSSANQFNNDVLRWTINGLLGSGLLSDEKTGALKDFLASPIILTEISDVLNMRIAAISTWSWEDEIPVEQRMHVTGKYHVYIDEELLQAIFLQYIGIKWSVFFKSAFTNFSNFDGAWASLRPSIPTMDKKRREYFIGIEMKKPSVQAKRQGLYKSIFFMSQLPDSPDEQISAVDGEEEVDYQVTGAARMRQTARKSTDLQQMYQAQATAIQQAPPGPPYPMAQQQQSLQQHQQGLMMLQQQNKKRLSMQNGTARMMMARQEPYHEEYDPEPKDKLPKSPMATKQFLLHLLSTELLVNTRIHGDFTCTRSEFLSWSPTLPHSTISSVLSFFGLSKKWLGFFRKFLEAPLKFTEDGPDAPTRRRKRGVPGAHSLSLICGEAILFCLDYAVNQETNGAQLYRMHDDFWLWSPKHETVVKGYSAITKFAEIMGVTLNKGKSGSIRIMKDQKEPTTVNSPLPDGQIRWGFLYMDPISGKFVIDQDMVDTHIGQLQRQLQDKNKSVFSWVQAWNTYAGTFFKSNFGKPANCFGREHVDMMLATMSRIQKRIFSESNVVEYLKTTIEKRFGVSDIPDGYLYFPTTLGGLELQNPFIGLVQVKNSVSEDPTTLLDDFFEAEEEAYRQAKKSFDKDQNVQYRTSDGNFRPKDGDQFFSFEEYTRYREEFWSNHGGNLVQVYEELLEQPEPVSVDLNAKEEEEFENFSSELNDGDDYMKWVVLLYGGEMKEKFGGLKIVEKGLLPMGMVTLFRSGRVKWQG